MTKTSRTLAVGDIAKHGARRVVVVETRPT